MRGDCEVQVPGGRAPLEKHCYSCKMLEDARGWVRLQRVVGKRGILKGREWRREIRRLRSVEVVGAWGGWASRNWLILTHGVPKSQTQLKWLSTHASLIIMRTVVDTKSILDDRTVLKPKASQHCLLPRESSWPPAAVIHYWGPKVWPWMSDFFSPNMLALK